MRSGFILKSWPWGQGAWFLNDLGCNMISFSTLLSEHSIEVGGVGDARVEFPGVACAWDAVVETKVWGW